MLILNRDLSQFIIIDDEITVTVLEIQKGQVKLGIDAPEDVAIWREEIYESIQYGGENK